MNTKPHSSDHHLNNQDFERVAGQDQHSQMIPMLCNEEDCFIDGSELGVTRANRPEGVSVCVPGFQIPNIRSS